MLYNYYIQCVYHDLSLSYHAYTQYDINKSKLNTEIEYNICLQLF